MGGGPWALCMTWADSSVRMRMQVDELKSACEDELSARFAAQPAAWNTALALCADHRHATQRLLHLATRHLLCHAPALLMAPAPDADAAALHMHTPEGLHGDGEPDASERCGDGTLQRAHAAAFPLALLERGAQAAGGPAESILDSSLELHACAMRQSGSAAAAVGAATAALAAQALAKHRQVLRPSLYAEVRDRLVALVALADDNMEPADGGM